MADTVYHHRSHLRTQKKHKKMSKRRSWKKTSIILSKKIGKIKTPAKALNREERVNRIKQKRSAKLLSSSIKKNNRAQIPSLCFLLNLNDLVARTDLLVGDKITETLDRKSPLTEIRRVVEKIGKTRIKLDIIRSSREAHFYSIIDLAKVADSLILKINFSKKEDYFNFSLSPEVTDLFRALRCQGTPNLFVAVTDAKTPSQKERSLFTKKVLIFVEKHLAKSPRVFFVSEEKSQLEKDFVFSRNSKTSGNELKSVWEKFPDEKKLLMALSTKKQSSNHWRLCRSYLLAQSVSSTTSKFGGKTSELNIRGFLKGKAMRQNGIAHISGIGDFRYHVTKTALQGCFKSSSFDFFFPLKKPEENFGSNELESEEELDLQIDPDEFSKNDFEMKRVSYDFPNESEAPVDRPARERFQKYRGLQSLCSSPWPSRSVPSYYKELSSFRNFSHEARAFQTRSGPSDGVMPLQEVELSLSMDTEEAQSISSRFDKTRFPMILSSLEPCEVEKSLVHFKLKKSRETEMIEGKKTLEFNCGFRRYHLKPILSHPVPKSNRFHFVKKILNNDFFIASAVSSINLAREPVFVMTAASSPRIVAEGVFESVDTDRLIIKKIVLCGYPARIKKNKAVVQHMFFSPKDVKWFSSVELHTKLGLVGNIKESLGTHGHMKCVFSDLVKSNDIVCLPLYKRVFPSC